MRSVTRETPLNHPARKQLRLSPDTTRLAELIACGVVLLQLPVVLQRLLPVLISHESRYVEAKFFFEHLHDTEQR